MEKFTPTVHSIRSLTARLSALEQNHITLSELFIRLEYQICKLHNLPKNISLEDEIEKLKEELGNQVEGIEEQESTNDDNTSSSENVNPPVLNPNEVTTPTMKVEKESETQEPSVNENPQEYQFEPNYSNTATKKRLRRVDSNSEEDNDTISQEIDAPKIKITKKRNRNDNRIQDIPKVLNKASRVEVCSVKACEIESKHNHGQKAPETYIAKKSKPTPVTKSMKPSDETKVATENKKSVAKPAELPILMTSPREFCICRTPKTQNMIGCDFCDESYHNRCLKLSAEEVKHLKKDKWQCPKCKMLANKSIDKSKVSKDFFAIFAKMCSKGQMPPQFG